MNTISQQQAMQQATQRNWIQKLIAQNETLDSNSALTWMHNARDTATKTISNIPLPNRKQEAWRYTSMEKLFKQDFQFADKNTRITPTFDNWIFSSTDSYRIAFINGHCVPAMSSITNLPEAVKIGSLRAICSSDPNCAAKYLLNSGNFETDIFSVLNTALTNDGLIVHIPKHLKLDKPIEVAYINQSQDISVVSNLRSFIILESGAQVTLVEHFPGGNDKHQPNEDAQANLFNNIVTQTVLKPSARLEHIVIQNQALNTYHIHNQIINQHADSHYRNFTSSSGAKLSRININVEFIGKNAECRIDGLIQCEKKQTNDIHTNIMHTLPHCSSRETVKTIVAGSGHAVFDGRIVVAKDAQKSDAQLSNKNLLLAEDAEVDTKPQLEIYANDVKCSHGTTVGQLDAEHVFYLRSRGLSEPLAKKLLCAGFTNELLHEISDKTVRDYLLTSTNEKLSVMI